ncbi:MAG: hypothetical protein R2751_18780 [Bacteroidales bacterium]
MKVRTLLLDFPSGPEKVALLKEVGRNPVLRNELCSLALEDQDPLSWRAAWILNGADEACPGIDWSFLPEIVESLPHLKSTGTLREFLRLLTRHPVPEDSQGLLIDRCFHYLAMERYPVAVKVHAMQIVFDHTLLYPELKEELSMVLQDQMAHGTAGFKSRGRKILARLEQM